LGFFLFFLLLGGVRGVAGSTTGSVAGSIEGAGSDADELASPVSPPCGARTSGDASGGSIEPDGIGIACLGAIEGAGTARSVVRAGDFSSGTAGVLGAASVAGVGRLAPCALGFGLGFGLVCLGRSRMGSCPGADASGWSTASGATAAWGGAVPAVGFFVVRRFGAGARASAGPAGCIGGVVRGEA
jgi:hypothetical protein